MQGVYTALITPFRNGAVDYEALQKLVEMQIAGQVDGIVPMGTTGESPTLNYDEHQKVIEFVVKTVNKRCAVIAGTGANCTSEAIAMTRHAAEIGADATLQVTPYYNKPTQEGLYRHFSEVAEKGGLPVVLYNIPGRSGVPIALDTAVRLGKNSNVVAIKEAAGSVDRVSQLINASCNMAVLSGDDGLTLPMMAVGACGVVSVASNLIPGEMKRLTSAMLSGNLAEALEIHQKYYDLFRDLFIETNPIPIKAAMAIAGYIAEEYRLPLCEMMPNNREQLIKSMQKAGVI